jgi:hypothetical protein
LRCVWNKGKCPEWFSKDIEILSKSAQILNERPADCALGFNEQSMGSSIKDDGVVADSVVLGSAHDQLAKPCEVHVNICSDESDAGKNCDLESFHSGDVNGVLEPLVASSGAEVGLAPVYLGRNFERLESGCWRCLHPCHATCAAPIAAGSRAYHRQQYHSAAAAPATASPDLAAPHPIVYSEAAHAAASLPPPSLPTGNFRLEGGQAQQCHTLFHEAIDPASAAATALAAAVAAVASTYHDSTPALESLAPEYKAASNPFASAFASITPHWKLADARQQLHISSGIHSNTT